MTLPPFWMHRWISDLLGPAAGLKAQPQLCEFFNEVATKWSTDFPRKRRGLDV